MRTLLLVGCAALVARAAAARAQVERPNVIVYGGFTLATMHGDSVPGPLHTGGFAAGAALAWRVASHVAIQPEVLFVQKGDDEADAFSGGVFTEHIRLNYVEVPVLLRVSSNAIAGVVPFLVGGPQVSFKTSCSIDVHGLPGNYTCADLPPTESTDWGVIAGGGIELPFLRHAISLGARYDWGLRDAFKNNLAKNRTFSMLVGWRIW